MRHFKGNDAENYMLLLAEANSEERECTAVYKGESFRWHYKPIDIPNIEGNVQAWGMRSTEAGVDTSYCVAHVARENNVVSVVFVPSALNELDRYAANCDDNSFYDFFDVVLAASEKLRAVDD
jgi:hypothetical protein